MTLNISYFNFNMYKKHGLYNNPHIYVFMLILSRKIQTYYKVES